MDNWYHAILAGVDDWYHAILAGVDNWYHLVCQFDNYYHLISFHLSLRGVDILY